MKRNKDMTTPALDLAKFIVSYLSTTKKERITQLKLQKLLYFAQAWHLAFADRPLFNDPIEAWVHGPVVRKVYTHYCHHRWSPLPIPQDVPRLPQDTTNHLKFILEVYGSLNARELEHLSHLDPPWQDAREGVEPHSSSSNVIELERLKQHYAQFI